MKNKIIVCVAINIVCSMPCVVALPTIQAMRQGIVRILRPAINMLKKHSFAAAAIVATTTLLAISKTRRTILNPIKNIRCVRAAPRILRRIRIRLGLISPHAMAQAIDAYDTELIEDLALSKDHILTRNDQDKNALFIATERGDRNLVQILLAHEAAPNFGRAENRTTPLQIAVTNGHRDIVQLLIAAGAHVNFMNNGMSALYLAAENGHLGIVQDLVAAGADVDFNNQFQRAPLHVAALHGHASIAQALLAAGAYINRIALGVSPLHLAAEQGHLATVELLITAGAAVNIQNSSYETPLHLAARMGHTAVVRALIMAGANVNALSRNGTPLHQAAARRHRRVVRLLIQKGADINIEDNQGHTFDQLTRDPIIIQCRALTDKLIGAVQRVDTAAVEKLLTRGASAISFDMQANTAIHSAIGTYNPERPTPLDTIARILVKTVGPAITLALNERGRTPLHNAVLQGNVRIAQLLLLNGAYTDVQDGDGNTPLHLATSSIMHQLLFLRYGANATIDNKEGKTPIHCNVELWQYGFSHLQ